MSGIPTPAQFMAEHGDPKTWCGAEFDEWILACESARSTRRHIEAVAQWMADHPKATRAELLAVIKGGAR